MTDKTVEQKYKVLSDIDHILLRPGMYIGSTAFTESEEYVASKTDSKISFSKQKLKYIPAFIKILNEVLDNAIDEHKRNPERLNQIKVTADQESGSITFEDNGGIPVELHSEFNEYVPEIIFGRLRSGSNYNDDDDQALIGTNGVGSKGCNIYSSEFVVDTWDGKKHFHQTYTNNMKQKSEPVIKASSKNGTTIKCTPDYARFQMEGLDPDAFARLYTMVINAAGCNPACKFFFNGERITIKSFEDYVKMFTDTYEFDENDNWKVAVAASKSESFETISFVNSVNTYQGGTHVNYVIDKITVRIREFLLKKHKIEVSPGMVRNHIQLFISANINRPKFSSQTKENMISEHRDYKTSWEPSDKFIKAILKSSVIQSVLDWVAAKAAIAANKDLEKLNKDTDKMKLRAIEKFTDATSKIDRKECMLFLTEGFSAASAVISARDPKTIGVYPMRGKPVNVYGLDKPADLVDNKEFADILAITGLKIGKSPILEDGNWVELEINGKVMIVNENDSIMIDGKSVDVSSLL